MNLQQFLKSLSFEERTELKQILFEQDEYPLLKPEVIQLIKLHKIPIENTGISRKCINALRSSRINTVGDLATFERNNILQIRNFGVKSFREVKSMLSSFDVTFEYFKFNSDVQKEAKRIMQIESK